MTGSSTERKVKAGLTGVPETLLWTLYFRASEASRADSVLEDPLAVRLLDEIEYPFEDYFGRAHPLQAQGQALRVLAFDREVRRFLVDHPDATVVALGEGLETQAWRVDNGQVRWITVELAETAQLRQALLPNTPRQHIVAGTVLDDDWMEEVDPTHAVLITAEGLLMYFQPREVHDLIARCAERFPGGVMLFDAMPRWFSRRTVDGKMGSAHGYQPPPMPWGVDVRELERLRSLSNVESLREVSLPTGRGFVFGRLMPVLRRTPLIGSSPLTILAPWRVFHVQFTGKH